MRTVCNRNRFLDPFSLAKGVHKLPNCTIYPRKVPSGKFSEAETCFCFTESAFSIRLSQLSLVLTYHSIETALLPLSILIFFLICHRGFTPVPPQLLKKLTKLFVRLRREDKTISLLIQTHWRKKWTFDYHSRCSWMGQRQPTLC